MVFIHFVFIVVWLILEWIKTSMPTFVDMTLASTFSELFGLPDAPVLSLCLIDFRRRMISHKWKISDNLPWNLVTGNCWSSLSFCSYIFYLYTNMIGSTNAFNLKQQQAFQTMTEIDWIIMERKFASCFVFRHYFWCQHPMSSNGVSSIVGCIIKIGLMGAKWKFWKNCGFKASERHSVNGVVLLVVFVLQKQNFSD